MQHIISNHSTATEWSNHELETLDYKYQFRHHYQNLKLGLREMSAKDFHKSLDDLHHHFKSIALKQQLYEQYPSWKLLWTQYLSPPASKSFFWGTKTRFYPLILELIGSDDIADKTAKIKSLIFFGALLDDGDVNPDRYYICDTPLDFFLEWFIAELPVLEHKFIVEIFDFLNYSRWHIETFNPLVLPEMKKLRPHINATLARHAEDLFTKILSFNRVV